MKKMINTIAKTDNPDNRKRQMKDQKRKEMSVSEQRQWWDHWLEFVIPIFVFVNSERSELWIKMKIGITNV